MSENARFAFALSFALLLALLMSMLFLLPECVYEPGREACLAAKRQGILTYILVAAALVALAVGLHLKGSRVGSLVAVLALIIVPFVAASLVAR